MAAGFELLPVDESHLCCGSAGAYSVLNPEIADQLKQRKLGNLQASGPAMILSGQCRLPDPLCKAAPRRRSSTG